MQLEQIRDQAYNDAIRKVPNPSFGASIHEYGETEQEVLKSIEDRFRDKLFIRSMELLHEKRPKYRYESLESYYLELIEALKSAGAAVSVVSGDAWSMDVRFGDMVYRLRLSGVVKLENPTKEELKALFDECNRMYFWGKLGKCSFFYFPKTTLGCLGKYQDRQDSKGRPNDQIWFAQIVHWTEKELRRVMIHEMVHMYNKRVEKHWWYGLLGHGQCFRKHRRRIRRDFGIDIMDGSEAVYVKEEYKPKTWEKVLQWLIDR